MYVCVCTFEWKIFVEVYRNYLRHLEELGDFIENLNLLVAILPFYEYDHNINSYACNAYAR